MDDGLFELDLDRIKLFGWQGFVGFDTVRQYVGKILRGENINPLVVVPHREYGPGEEWLEYRLHPVLIPSSSDIDGGHHRAFAYDFLGVSPLVRMPRMGDRAYLPPPARRLYIPIRKHIVCSGSSLGSNIDGHLSR